MPTTDMVVMPVTAVAMADTDMVRGPLMPMPTTDMVVMPVTAVATDTAMARGPLTLTTDMAVMLVTAVAMDMAMASNSNMAAIISELSSCFYATQNPDKLRKNYYLIYKLINFN